MKNEIILKIKNELSRFKDECQVFYIMGQIRKFLEANFPDKGERKYPLLLFYGNWVLHPKICNVKVIEEKLEKIGKDHNEQMDFVSLENLRHQLKNFSAEFDLSTDVFKNDKKWEKFKCLLYDILVDVPLEGFSGSIQQFSFEKLLDPKVPIKSGVRWKISYKNGSSANGRFMVIKQKGSDIVH